MPTLIQRRRSDPVLCQLSSKLNAPIQVCTHFLRQCTPKYLTFAINNLEILSRLVFLRPWLINPHTIGFMGHQGCHSAVLPCQTTVESSTPSSVSSQSRAGVIISGLDKLEANSQSSNLPLLIIDGRSVMIKI